MKTLSVLIAVFTLMLTACVLEPLTSPPSYVPPFEPPPLPSSFVLSGTVREQAGIPVAGVQVVIVGSDSKSPRRWTITDANGVFRFAEVAGGVQLTTYKFGFESYQQQLLVHGDARIDIPLTHRKDLDLPDPLLLEPGTTVHAVTNEPPCDPVRWDAEAPCKRFHFLAPATGQLFLTITFSGEPLDASVVAAATETYVATSKVASQGITLRADVSAGALFEIRVNSYYRSQEFDLHADFF